MRPLSTWHPGGSLTNIRFVSEMKMKCLKMKDSCGLEEQLLPVNFVSWKSKTRELVTFALKYCRLRFRQMCRSWILRFWWPRITVISVSCFSFHPTLKCTPSFCLCLKNHERITGWKAVKLTQIQEAAVGGSWGCPHYGSCLPRCRYRTHKSCGCCPDAGRF